MSPTVAAALERLRRDISASVTVISEADDGSALVIVSPRDEPPSPAFLMILDPTRLDPEGMLH